MNSTVKKDQILLIASISFELFSSNVKKWRTALFDAMSSEIIKTYANNIL